MVDPSQEQRKRGNTMMFSGIMNPPKIEIKQPPTEGSEDAQSYDTPVNELLVKSEEFPQLNVTQQQSDSISAFSSVDQKPVAGLTNQQRVVPALNLNKQGSGGGIASASSIKTANEIEKERLASGKVSGPLDKEWQNFGIPKAAGEDDNEQIIDLNKPLSLKKMQKIKETVDTQLHEVVRNKRGWAYYEKHQPDYAAFQAEVKKVIMTLIGPTVSENTKNGMRIIEVSTEQDKLSRRLEEVEMVYKRVVKNASAQQDALTDLETRSKALRITEERLREQVKQCEGIKTQLNDKFKMLRDDRSVTIARLDHTDNELLQYRKDIRELHDQISASVLDAVGQANARSLVNENNVIALTDQVDKLYESVEVYIKDDLRKQAVEVSSLKEFFIEQRKLIQTLDKALVTEFRWLERNKLYDHEISLLTSNLNNVQSEFRIVNDFMNDGVQKSIQNQIAETMQAVLGDRKKYLRKLKEFQSEFYSKIGEKGGLLSEANRQTPEDPFKVNLNSSDDDSDNSIDRLNGYIDRLQKDGRLKMGGGGPVGSGLEEKDVTDILKRHDEDRLGKLRQKYVDKIPLRRQGMYKEDQNNQFVLSKLSKLHVITNKQIKSCSQLGGRLYIRSRRGSSGGSSRSKMSRTGSSKLSVNAGVRPNKRSSILPMTPTKMANVKQSKTQKQVEMEHKFEVQIIEFDRRAIQEVFDKLRSKNKIQVAKEVSAELVAQNEKHDILLFKVKVKTINNAIAAYKKDKKTEMSMLQLSALFQMLSLEQVVDANGKEIKNSDFISKKRTILTNMIELEKNQKEGEEDSSVSDTSQGSSRQDMRLKPPAIGIIETELATDRSKRSKTVLIPKLSSRVDKNFHQQRSDTSSMTESQSIVADTQMPPSKASPSKSPSPVKMSQLAQNDPRTKTAAKVQQAMDSMQELRSVESEKISDSQTSQSLERHSNRPVKLALQKMDQRPNSAESSAKKQVEIVDQEHSKSNQKKQPESIENVKKQATMQKGKTTTKTDREGEGDKNKRQTILSSYGEESFDYPEETHSNEEDTTSMLARIGSEEFIVPDTQEIPDTDTILLKMKDQIDVLEANLGARTSEIRKVDNYVKRLEKAIVEELESDFRQTYLKIDFVEADIKDHISQKLNLVSGQLRKSNANVNANKDSAMQENLATKKRVKVFGRRVDQRMDEVNRDHDRLTGKYDYLIHCNDYLAKLAEQIITITELNSCLMSSDERDKNSICLMGSQGPKSLQTKQNEQHLHRIQQQIDDMEKSEAERTGSGTQNAAAPISRPKSGVSHVSQHTYALSHKTNQTSSKPKVFAPSDDQQIVQIDKRCISCSDGPSQLVQMFKMACLSYFPSKVDYQGKKYAKPLLIQRQEEYVNELRDILQLSGANPYFDCSEEITKKRMEERMKSQVCEEAASSGEDEGDTQMNSDQKRIASSDDQTVRNNIASSHDTPEKLSAADAQNDQTHFEALTSKSNFLGTMKQSNLKNPTKTSANSFKGSRKALSPTPGNIIRQSSPGTMIETEGASERPTPTPQAEFQDQNAALQHSNLKPIDEGSIRLITSAKGQTTRSGLHKRQVSFDASHNDVAALSQAGHAVRQLQHVQTQNMMNPQVSQPAPVPGQQTSFRFNASHELLAFNQEQIAKIVPNPVSSQYESNGAPVDEKLLQIQKLKEKALMIQLSREVNKGNSFVSNLNKAKTPLANLQSRGSSKDIFPTQEQVEFARDMARRKHTKETQIMIDTREKFTKRFQFDKLSHQMMSGTPTETQLSGSAHNQLARYDSKTIFRNVQRGQTEAERAPQNYANLIGNKSPSLPNLTRQFSAAHTRPGRQNAEDVTADMLNLAARYGRNQRPISSMNETSQNFWRTAQRHQDGKQSMVIVANPAVSNQVNWNRQRESAGTEQIREQLKRAGTQSMANFSQN